MFIADTNHIAMPITQPMFIYHNPKKKFFHDVMATRIPKYH